MRCPCLEMACRTDPGCRCASATCAFRRRSKARHVCWTTPTRRRRPHSPVTTTCTARSTPSSTSRSTCSWAWASGRSIRRTRPIRSTSPPAPPASRHRPRLTRCAASIGIPPTSWPFRSRPRWRSPRPWRCDTGWWRLAVRRRDTEATRLHRSPGAGSHRRHIMPRPARAEPRHRRPVISGRFSISWAIRSGTGLAALPARILSRHRDGASRRTIRPAPRRRRKPPARRRRRPRPGRPRSCCLPWRPRRHQPSWLRQPGWRYLLRAPLRLRRDLPPPVRKPCPPSRQRPCPPARPCWPRRRRRRWSCWRRPRSARTRSPPRASRSDRPSVSQGSMSAILGAT